MIENVVERAIVPHNPSAARVLNKDKYNLFAPVAGPGKVGMASFAAKFFEVKNQEVFIKDGVIPSVINDANDASDANTLSAEYALQIFAQLNSDIELHAQEIGDLWDDIDVLQEAIGNLWYDIDGLWEVIGDLWEDIDEISTELTEVETRVATNTADIATNAASISRIDTALIVQEDLNRSVEHRLGKLEIGTLDTVEKSGEAYAVNVPAEALPWVSIDKIGGKTYVELTEAGAVIADSGVTLNGTLDKNPTFYSCNVVVNTVERDNYAVVIDVLGGSYSGGTVSASFVDSLSAGNVLIANVPNAVGRYVYFVDASSIVGADLKIDGVSEMAVWAKGVTFNDFRFDITLYEGVIPELVSTPVTAVKMVGKNVVNNDVSDADYWESYQEPHPTLGTITRYIYPLTLPSDGLFVLTRSMISVDNVYLYLQVSTDGGITYTEANAALDASGNPIRGVVASKNTSYKTLYINNQEGYRWRLWANDAYSPAKIEWLQIEAVNQIGRAPSSYAPYSERIYAIPEAVQALDDYGCGIRNDYHNRVEWREDGCYYVRKVSSQIFDGSESENWVYVGTNVHGISQFNINPRFNPKTGTIISNSYVEDDTPFDEITQDGIYSTPTEGIKIYTANCNSLEEWLSVLRRESENPLTVIYALAAPKEENISSKMDFDAYVDIESNGSIYFINKGKSAVPYAITYQKMKGT